MILESGIIVAIGVVLWFSKLSWRGRMRMLSNALLVDIAVFILLTALHWGTYSGVMAATVGSVIVSLLLTLGRKLWGYTEKGRYFRGMWDVYPQLMQEK